MRLCLQMTFCTSWDGAIFHPLLVLGSTLITRLAFLRSWYAVAPQGGVVEEIDGVTDTFLLSNRDIDRSNDKHRGIFEVWDGFFNRGVKPSYKELKRIKLANFRKEKAPHVLGGAAGQSIP